MTRSSGAPHPLIGRVASLGLALVLFSLAGFAIWSAALTERSATTAHASATESALLTRAQYLVAWESSLQREYGVQSDPDVRERFDAAAGRLVATLRELQRSRGAGDGEATYARLLALQGQYHDACRHFFAAVRAGDRWRAAALDDDAIEPALAAMMRLVHDAAQREQDAAAADLRALADTARVVRASTAPVFGFGLGLGLLLWALSRRAARRHEERSRALAEHASDLVAIIDAAGVMRYASPSHQRLLGHAPHALEGRPARALVHPDDLPCARAAYAARAGQDGAGRVELRLRHADGSWRTVETVITDRRGDPAVGGIIATSRDITERAHAEAAERARVVAERANQAKSEFLSRMSHELRTPLNAILGFAQVLELDDLSPDQRQSVGQILRGGRHLLGLINEVLDIARIEARRLELAPEPVAVDTLVGECLDLIAPLAAQRDVRLQRDRAATARGDAVLADQQRVRQVLLNLLSNAVKYNRPGGMVALSCAAAGAGRLRLAVRDTGPGLAPHHLARLFTPFERLGTAGSGVEGTGLGLALSKSLVEAMGGTIGVESAVGEGSSFWVELPRAVDDALAA